jgi:hemoglobin-like flavoprotein
VNHRQIELVRLSFERIERGSALFADLFHRRLFLIAPALERLADVDVERRDRALFATLREIVTGLDRLDLLLPSLASTARGLGQQGVTAADYDATGAALEWTLQQVLAHAPGVVVAWTDTYELLAGVMKRAADDPMILPPPPPPRRAFVTHGYSDRPPPSRRATLPPPSSRLA